MEGIETGSFSYPPTTSSVSVGAPTWRGLKRDAGTYVGASGWVSVGAPTWRGLKPMSRAILQFLNLCQ